MGQKVVGPPLELQGPLNDTPLKFQKAQPPENIPLQNSSAPL